MNPLPSPITVPAISVSDRILLDDSKIQIINNEITAYTNSVAALFIDDNQNIGIGTLNPTRKLTINNSTGNCLRLSYNSNYTDFLLNSDGSLNITSTGLFVNFNNDININGYLYLNNSKINLTANQINYLDTTPGSASSLKSLIFDSNTSIQGINSLTAISLFGTIQTGSQPNITSVNTLDIVNHNGLSLEGVVIIASSSQINSLVVTPGIASASKALILDSNRNIININTFNASNIYGTLQTINQPNITSIGTLTNLYVSGNIGIGTLTPQKRLEVNSSSGNCMRLTYNSTNYTDLTINNLGELIISSIGNNIHIENNNNFNIRSHNGSSLGLCLNGVLVTATATEINYIDVSPGVATASKAMVLDSNKNIININNLTATTISGQLTIGDQPNITSIDTLNITTSLSLSGVLIQASAVQLNYLYNLTPGIASSLKALVLDSNRNINNINSLTATNLTGTILTSNQPNIATVNTLNITNHDGLTIGLALGGIIVTATATQLNYINTPIGIAAASKAIILDNSKNISGINNLSVTNITGTLQTSSQPNISSVNILDIVNHNGSTIGLSLNGTLVQSTAVQINYLTTPIGIAGPRKAVVLDDSISITGINSITASSVYTTIQTSVQPFINQVNTLNINDHNGIIGLSLAGILVTASANQINSLNVSEGIAVAHKALIVNSSTSISGINNLSATSLTGVITTASQPNISSVNNLNIINHDGSSNGLSLNNILVIATAIQLNYLVVTPGTALASSALVLDSSKNINNINNLTANNLYGTLQTGAQPNISSINTLNITNSLSLAGILITANATQLNYINVTPGVVAPNKAIVSDANNSISGLTSLTATNLTGTLQTTSQPNINSVYTLDISHHDNGSQGLKLGGNLVTASASQLNYNNVTPGIAAISSTLVVDINKNITGINSLGVNQISTSSLTAIGSISNFNTGGILVNSYSNTDLIGRIVKTEVLTTIALSNYNPAGLTNNYSCELIGYILPIYSESYTFYIVCNDRIRLWVNNVMILHSWSSVLTQQTSSSINLTANKYYPIYIQYQNDSDVGALSIQWRSSSQTLDNIPTNNLAWDNKPPNHLISSSIQNSINLYNSSTANLNNCTFTVNNVGDMTIDSSGNDIIIASTDNFNIASHNGTNGLYLGGILVTSTADQINTLNTTQGTASPNKALIVDGTKSLGGLSSLTATSIFCTNLSAANFTIASLGVSGAFQNLNTGGILVNQILGAENEGRYTNTALTTSLGITNYNPSNISGVYSLEYVGYILPVYSQAYTFQITVNDKIRAFINNTLIINSWTSNNGATIVSSPINLTAGVWYPIYIQYQVISSTMSMQVRWTSTSQPLDFIPANRMAWDNKPTNIKNNLFTKDSLVLYSGGPLSTSQTANINISSLGLLTIASSGHSTTFDSNESINIASHNGSTNGLYLGGSLVLSTATQLNYLSGVVAGTAVNNMALVLNNSGDINGINSISANTLNGTIATAYQPNITSLANLDITNHNASTTGLKLGGVLVIASADQINYLVLTPGIATASKALVLDSNKTITGITTLSATNLTGLITTANQPNITTIGTLTSLTISGNLNATLTTAIQPNITSLGSLSSLIISGTTDASSPTVGGSFTSSGGGAFAKSLYIGGSIYGTLATNAQPNITSIGTLSSLTLNGAISGVTTLTATTLVGTLSTGYQPFITSVGTLTSLVLTGSISGVTTLTATSIAGLLTTVAQTNITSVGILSSLTISGALTSNLSTATTSNTTGAILLSGGIGISNTTDATSNTNGGTLTSAGGAAFAKSVYIGGSIFGTIGTATQNTITSIGTLTTLSVSGVSATSNIKITTTANYNGVMDTASIVLKQASITNGNKVSLDFIISTNDIDAVNTATCSIVHERLSAYMGDLIFLTKRTATATNPLTEALRISSTGTCSIANTSSGYQLNLGASGTGIITNALTTTSLTISGSTASSSNTTGSLTLSGGIGISLTTDATSSTNGGTFTSAGGGAFAKALYVGTTLTATTLVGTLSASSAAQTNITSVGTLASLNYTGLITGGTISAAARLLIYGSTSVTNSEGSANTFQINASTNGSFDKSSLYMGADATLNYGWIQSSRSGANSPITINGRGGTVAINTNSPNTSYTFHVNGLTLLSNTTGSTNSTTGALVLTGGICTNLTTDATSSTNGGTFTSAGGGAFAKALYVGTTLTATTLVGTLSTPTQTNITSVGTLSSLIVSSTTTNQINYSDTNLNIISYPLALRHTISSGTPAIGIGSGIQFYAPDSTNTTQLQLGAIDAVSTSVTTATYSGNLIFKNSFNGSIVSAMTLSSTGATTSTLTINGTSTLVATNITGLLSVASAAQSNITSVGTLTSLTTSGTLTSNLPTASTSNSTGSVLLSGGIGINNTTDATSSTNGGTFTSAGGGAFAKSLYVGTTLTATTLTGLLSVASASQTNITSVGTLASMNYTGLITGGTISSAARLLIYGSTSTGNSESSSNTFQINSSTNGSFNKASLFMGADATGNHGWIQVAGNGAFNPLIFNGRGGVVCVNTNSPNISYSFHVNGRTLLADTTGSSSSTAGALVMTGGISTNLTTDATSSTNGGTFTSAGGGAFAKSLFVGSNLTVGGNLTISGTTTTINSTNINISDNILLLNSGPTGTFDSGILTQRYQVDNSSGTGDIVNDTANATFSIISATSTSITPGSGAPSGYYDGWWIKITSGAATGQVRKIISWSGPGGTATLDNAFSITPSAGNGVSFYNRSFTSLIWQESNKRFTTAYTANDTSGGPLTIIDYADFATNNLIGLSSITSTSNSTGSLQLAGGIGISNTTDATSSTNGGTLTSAGGGAFAKSLYIGGSLMIGTSTDTSRMISCLDSTMSNTSSKYITLGKSASTNNQFELTYLHVSDNSSLNACQFGFYGTSRFLTLLTNGKFGIGTMTPQAPLELTNASGLTECLRLSYSTNVNSTPTVYSSFSVNSSGILSFGPSSYNNAISIDTSGNIGLGISPNTSYPLYVSRTVSTTISGGYGYLTAGGNTGTGASTGSQTFSAYFEGRIRVGAEVDLVSDYRLKKDINSLDVKECKDFIFKTNPVSFRYKNNDKILHWGYVAQDIHKAGYEDMTSLTPCDDIEEIIEDDGFINPAGFNFNMSTTSIIPILAVNIKELYQENEDLKKKNKELEDRLKRLEEYIFK